MSQQAEQAVTGLYAFTECEAVDMRNGTVLLIDKGSAAQLTVAAPVAQSMPLCRVFRTLEQHAQVLASTIPELAGQHADILKVLGLIRDAGLMVSAESTCAQLNAETPAVVDLAPTRVFIITCDRPAAIDRLLESMLHAGNLSRHQALVLIDDSRDPDNAAKNRQAVSQFNLTSARDMLYFGADEARQFMLDMIAKQPQQEQAIRFLLDRERWRQHKSYGLARNFSLLLSVGCRAIVLDDDIICAAVQSPHRAEGLQFGQIEREADFYRDFNDMVARTQRAEFDPLSGHAACLGLNLGQAIPKLNGGHPLAPGDLAGANAAYLSQWHAQSRVLVTQSGSMGDPGTPDTTWLMTLDPASSQRLANFAPGLQSALASRCYWLGHRRPMFTKMSVISQLSGLDNTALLPPYMPVFRGEDYLFGAMTEHLHPGAAVLEYDWAVPHMPLQPRRGDPAPAPASGKGNININKYITDHTHYAAGISPGTRLDGLVALLQQLAESDDQSLRTAFRREVAESQAAESVTLGKLLRDDMVREPAWQSWLQRSAAAVQAASQQPAQFSDVDAIPAGLDDGEILARFRSFTAEFAGALKAWRAIRSAAEPLAAALVER